MAWYISKIVFQIICGDGEHAAQFDEQLRLIAANNEVEAFDKAVEMGTKEQDTFYNHKKQLVQWRFVHVPELYPLSGLIDGAELYSRINEVDDAKAYITFVEQRAVSIQQKKAHSLLNLI
jgi:hypothetical protein